MRGGDLLACRIQIQTSDVIGKGVSCQPVD